MCFFLQCVFFAPDYCTKIFQKILEKDDFCDVSGCFSTKLGVTKCLYVVTACLQVDFGHGAKPILHLGAIMILRQILHLFAPSQKIQFPSQVVTFKLFYGGPGWFMVAFGWFAPFPRA